MTRKPKKLNAGALAVGIVQRGQSALSAEDRKVGALQECAKRAAVVSAADRWSFFLRPHQGCGGSLFIPLQVSATTVDGGTHLPSSESVKRQHASGAMVDSRRDI